jgi:hypothetical protein
MIRSHFINSNVQEYNCYNLGLLNFWILFVLSYSNEHNVSEVASLPVLIER